MALDEAWYKLGLPKTGYVFLKNGKGGLSESNNCNTLKLLQVGFIVQQAQPHK